MNSGHCPPNSQLFYTHSRETSHLAEMAAWNHSAYKLSASVLVVAELRDVKLGSSDVLIERSDTPV